MRITLIVLILTFFNWVTNAQTSLSQINLQAGQHKVGFQHILVHDSTRSYSRVFDWTNQNIPRPIPVSMWYPAGIDIEIEPMSVLDYMRILKEEEEWELLPDEQILNWFYYTNTEANQNHLQEYASAYYDAPKLADSYPVIIYAPSYQASSIENFAMCEFLASHGYVVISSPSRGFENRFLEGATVKDMETQARDIEFLISKAGNWFNINPQSIAVAGFSFGGLSQVMAQMRDDRIKVLVSLDGSIKYQYNTLRQSPFYNLEAFDIPFIHFSQKEIPKEVLLEDQLDSTLNTQFKFFDDLEYSDAYHFQFHHLTHSYFSTLGVLFNTRDIRQDKSDQEIMQSYRWLCVYTLNFLNAYLKNDQNSLNFIKSDSREVTDQRSIISEVSKKSAKYNFTFQDFYEHAKARRYKDMNVLYDSIKTELPSFVLQESMVNNLGLQLVFNSNIPMSGLLVLKFATSLYPDSANLWDSLAEAFLHLNDVPSAKESFEKSLKLNPQNQNAIQRLSYMKRNEN